MTLFFFLWVPWVWGGGKEEGGGGGGGRGILLVSGKKYYVFWHLGETWGVGHRFSLMPGKMPRLLVNIF